MAEELYQEATAENQSSADLPDVKLTPKAVEMVVRMRDKEGLPTDQGLRIGVVG